MDEDTIKKFILNAAEETFATMLGWPVTSSKSFTESPKMATTSERVVALIGLTGSYTGTGILSCSPELACHLSSQMLMTHLPVIDSEVLDVMSEISNMIFGNVKTMLEEQVGLLGLSVPTVIYGRNFRTRSLGTQQVGITLQVEEYPLDLNMYLSQNYNNVKPSMGQQPMVVSV